MAKHLLLAFTNPLEGRDQAYNEWYNTVAIPTYKSLPGLVPLGRFKAVDVPHLFPFEMENDFQYLSLYYFESDDPVQFMENIKATFPDRPEYKFSADIDTSRFFEPIFVAISDLNFAPLENYENLKR